MLEDARIPAFFGAGALLSVVQIRFVILTISGTILITTAELDTAQNIILLLILAFCMVWDLLLPILVYVLAGSRSTEVLEKMNHWLVKQERWIMFTLLALFGTVLLTAGISELGIFQG